ncbi:DUF488 domain-containing protein [bacterium]|nr:DUF488 domain-containing protein [bacterium]
MERYFYTIGYEGLSQDEFIDILTKENISHVVDVRRNPISRKKGFSKNGLREALDNNGIEYSHLRSLGIDSSQRKNLQTTQDYASLLRWYKKNTIPNSQELLQAILGLIEEASVVLLCFEKDYHICHRSIIAEELAHLSDNEVYHLRRQHVNAL